MFSIVCFSFVSFLSAVRRVYTTSFNCVFWLHWICYLRMSVVPSTHVFLYGVLEHDSVVDLKAQACKLKHSQVCFAIMSWCCTRCDSFVNSLNFVWLSWVFPQEYISWQQFLHFASVHQSSSICLIFSSQNDDPFWFFYLSRLCAQHCMNADSFTTTLSSTL